MSAALPLTGQARECSVYDWVRRAWRRCVAIDLGENSIRGRVVVEYNYLNRIDSRGSARNTPRPDTRKAKFLMQRKYTPQSDPNLKQCTQCGEVKPLGEFVKDKRHSDGLTSNCKKCCRERSRAWAAANPERQRARTSAWNASHPDQAREYSRRWDAAHREERREANKRWYVDKHEVIQVRKRNHRASHPEVDRAGNIVIVAVRAGKLTRAAEYFCFVCGTSADQGATMEYHHVDYSKPLEVIPVCSSCHKRWHAAAKAVI